MTGISAIETLLSGQYIEVVPSNTGERTTEFVGRLNPPVGARYPDGKKIILESPQLGSIVQGTPVYFRNFRAGEVEHVELGEGDGLIKIYAMVDKQFASHVHETSLFWNASGIDAHLGLDGLNIRTQGLAAVVGGGIAFSSPDENAPVSRSNSVFRLHAGADAAREARLRSQSLELRIESTDGDGIDEGTPVYYRRLKIGQIGESWLTPDARAVRGEVFIEPRFRPLIREDTRFYKSSGIDVSLGLDGLRVRSRPLRSVTLGGVSTATPDPLGKPSQPLALYALYAEPEDDWHEWSPALE